MGLMGARSARFIFFCQFSLTRTNLYRTGLPPGFATRRTALPQTFVSCTFVQYRKTPAHRNGRLP